VATGGPSPQPVQRADSRGEAGHNLAQPLVTEQVRAFLTREDHGMVIWEDPLANAEDRWVRDRPQEQLLFVGDEVYHVLSHSTASPTAVTAGLRGMGAWWGSPVVLAALPPETLRPFLTRRASLAAEQLQPLVDHCRLLYFLAYDREGYVLWSPGEGADAGNQGHLRDRGP
jgi:hypothetical protein